LKRRPLLGRAGIEQLANYDYPDVGLWHKGEAQRCRLFGRYQGKSGRRGHRVFVDAEVIRGGPLLEVAAHSREAWRAAPGSAPLL